jgi:hypothetical protein
MREEIKIVVAEAHKLQLDNSAVSDELNEVQAYFDQNKFDFQENTINFVFLKGEYSQIKRTMVVMGVFVNKISPIVFSFNAKLKLKFKDLKAQIATTKVTFPQEFIGELNYNEGMLFHIEIPVKGLEQDEQFKFSDIDGQLVEVEVLKKETLVD